MQRVAPLFVLDYLGTAFSSDVIGVDDHTLLLRVSEGPHAGKEWEYDVDPDADEVPEVGDTFQLHLEIPDELKN